MCQASAREAESRHGRGEARSAMPLHLGIGGYVLAPSTVDAGLGLFGAKGFRQCVVPVNMLDAQQAS